MSLDNIVGDVAGIRKGMNLTSREHETHHHPLLKDFLEEAESKVKKVGAPLRFVLVMRVCLFANLYATCDFWNVLRYGRYPA